MTSGIAGSGPYSLLRDLRFQVKQLKEVLANEPMGRRKRRGLEQDLNQLKARLKAVNAEIREAKKLPRSIAVHL
jgi:hypothetical protein